MRNYFWTMYLVLNAASGCSLFRADNAVSPEEALVRSEQAAADELDKTPNDLKQAKIWTKLDAIEQEQSRQRARIKLLEQGLLLGVVPDELRNPDDVEHELRIKKKAQKGLEDTSPQPPTAVEGKVPQVSVPLPNSIIEKSSDRAKFEQELAAAQDLFREGKYGKAVVAFEAIDNLYQPELTGGAQNYWIGLSWFNLKEYDAAQKNLQTLVSKYSASPWIPRAKLYLARIQLRRGLREQALAALQKVISEYSSEDAADMARADIEALKENL